jgi:hypothetical protein
MPEPMERLMRLTDLTIKALKSPPSGVIYYTDDLLTGFGVRVSEGGTKSFVLTHGKLRKRETIGRVGILGLGEARGDANLMTMRDILLNGWQKYESYILAADELTADWFAAKKFDIGINETKQALFVKIEDLITKVDILKGMFKATKTKVRIDTLMDTPGVVIIDNSVKTLTEKGSEVFGRFFIAQILAAAQQREGREDAKKLPVYVYLDEAQFVIKNDPIRT